MADKKADQYGIGVDVVNHDHHETALDSLRLSERDRQLILTSLDRQSGAFQGINQRGFDRVSLMRLGPLVTQVQHPGGSTAMYLVHPRNFSTGGISFIHGNFLYPGTICMTHLPMVAGGNIAKVCGRIVRCRHVRGKIHEIGVKFDQPIEIAEFSTDQSGKAQKKDQRVSMELPPLAGKLLYLHDSENDRQLLEFLLGRLGVEMAATRSAQEAILRAQSGEFQMVFLDGDLADVDIPQLVQTLRSGGYEEPIVAVTAEDQDSERLAKLMGCTAAVLVKPYQAEELVRLLSDHMPHGRANKDRNPLVSTKWNDPQMRPLILQFLGRLKEQLSQVSKSIDEGELAWLQKMCRDLKGSGSGYGYPQISELAKQIQGQIQDRERLQSVRNQFEELNRLCSAACMVE